MIMSQYPHFYEDKEGKKHRNMMQIETEPAAMSGAFPKDGNIMIRIQDEESQKAFKMTPQEALQFGTEIKEIAKELLSQKRELWKSKARSPVKK
ncbi:MAG: hypothetical protein V1911_01400 [Candidatus Micrarchaeota archaeon]